jgi:hypothetical protein
LPDSSVSQTVLFVSIVLTGLFTILSSAVTGFFQGSHKKLDIDDLRKAVEREKAEKLIEELDYAYARAHDAFIAASSRLVEGNRDTKAVLRPYEIGKVRVLCAYFPTTESDLRRYDDAVRTMNEEFNAGMKQVAKAGADPDLIKALTLKLSQQALRNMDELKQSVGGTISQRMPELL